MSGHSMCCPTGTEATHIPGPGQRWECRSPTNTEICNNGIDDDGDGLIDCTDEECNNLPTPLFEWNPLLPSFNCTNSPLTSDFCYDNPGVCDADGILPISADYYCSNGDNDQNNLGLCCGVGKYAKKIGTRWSCVDPDQCYDPLNPSNPAFNCNVNYDNESTRWLTKTFDFAGDSNWCVDTFNIPSQACCPVIRFGEYSYYSDSNNIKVY